MILTGFVADDDLVFLYSRAYALVQPSLLEGFGLPAVEAMACGTPVISSRAGSLPEVVGDAGVYFDPTDVDSIASAIGSFLNNETQSRALAQSARERAALFSWDHSARALARLLRRDRGRGADTAHARENRVNQAVPPGRPV